MKRMLWEEWNFMSVLLEQQISLIHSRFLFFETGEFQSSRYGFPSSAMYHHSSLVSFVSMQLIHSHHSAIPGWVGIWNFSIQVGHSTTIPAWFKPLRSYHLFRDFPITSHADNCWWWWNFMEPPMLRAFCNCVINS